MSNEILYYLIIFGSVILIGISMLVLGFFTMKEKKKEGVSIKLGSVYKTV